MRVTEEIKFKLVDLAEHDLRLQATMIAFGENMKQINENIKEITNVSVKLAERIKVLEADFSERSVKRQLMMILMTLYPFIIGALIIIANIDHAKVSELMKTIQDLTTIHS